MELNFKKKIRFILKLMIITLILVCAGLFFIKDENGRPFMTIEKIKVAAYLKYIEIKHLLKLDTVQEPKKDAITQKYPSPDDREYTEMYKYRDDKGVLHFTDIKPKKGKYEVMYMPVNKDNTVGEKIDGMINKVFNKKKKNETNTRIKPSDRKKEKGQRDIITQAKEIFQKTAGQYKDAPGLMENAKEVKQQVEEAYGDREKEMRKSE